MQVVIQSNDDIASRAIDLLKEIYTNLGPRLQVNQVRMDQFALKLPQARIPVDRTVMLVRFF